MKTLDEVTWAVENCDSAIDDCAHCPYYKDDCENLRPLRADALYYLREYKSDKDELDSTRLAYLDVLTDYVALKQYWAEQQANPPLTWDDLKQMEGKPVWWVHGEVGEWLTIYCVPITGNDSVLYATTCSGVECWIYKKDMDKYQYFRKERK